MERFAEQDRVEQMNAQKRRLKVAEHAREVERLIQEKKQMYEAAMVSIPPSCCGMGQWTAMSLSVKEQLGLARQLFDCVAAACLHV